MAKSKYMTDAELEVHESVRERYCKYMDIEPSTHMGVGESIGLSYNLSRYLLSRFAGGKQKLGTDILTKLSDFLEARGY